MDRSFEATFAALTGHDPFPWQKTLYEEWFAAGRFPASCNLPTGLGKTVVIAVWLIALVNHPGKMPRRLIYVVNRRTVVDQTTEEVEKLRRRLQNPDDFPQHAEILRSVRADLAKLSSNGDVPLAISTLRGQFADNRQWSSDPARPAVICGTIDMIGSRLLFSGYGVGFKAKPLHAGFLGQDVLLVHDEAHLEPAFQKLIETIACEQGGGRLDEYRKCVPIANRPKDYRPLRVMELTATTRSDVGRNGANAFMLQKEDRTHPVVKQRIEAAKRLQLHPVENDAKIAKEIAGFALKRCWAMDENGENIKDENGDCEDANVAVLIFVRTLDDVKDVYDTLTNKKGGVPADHVQQLTGTMRGRERDELAEHDPVFMRFLPEKNRNPAVEPMEGTVYLVCTSAGEVGVDISADHMACDLSTFESMAQRLGRANRYGFRADTHIDVVHPASFGKIDKKTGELKADEIDKRRQKTLELLKKLPALGENQYDASPLALSKLDADARLDAFAPEPTILPATDILFDAWALTSIRQPMPGRPAVGPYLHGIAEWQPPETAVAWREEVKIIIGELLDRYPPVDLLDEYPLKPQELLRDRSDRVFKHLETLANRHPDKPVWLVDDRGAIDPTTLEQLVDKKRKDRINGCTLLLPPSAGGLAGGMLVGTSEQADDVADITLPHPDARVRVWSDDLEHANKTAGMRRVKTVVDDSGDDEEPRRWEWFEHFPEEGGRTARKPVRWDTHVGDVVNHAKGTVANLSLPQEINDAIILAAELHDHGKQREPFQVALGNRRCPQLLLAKSGRRGARLPEPFRHEFASLFDAQADAQFNSLNEEMQDLVLHLIAAHHGRARPHFDLDEAFDPERTIADAEALAVETPRRFARLQRKYGRWGLAYLESLLRAADWAASANPSSFCEDEVGGEA